MRIQNNIVPQVNIEQVAQHPELAPSRWRVAWRIQNLGEQPLQLLTVRLPHSRFRSEERELAPALELFPEEDARLECSVACSELPGTVVENAFLIVRVLWREEPWRVFVRMRVVFDDQGGPQTVTEVVTVQRVGFSELLKHSV